MASFNGPTIMVGLMQLILSILIFAYRGSHTGYVCSGWYLSEEEKEVFGVKAIYDIEKGRFLFALMIINSFGLAFFAFSCLIGLMRMCGEVPQYQDP